MARADAGLTISELARRAGVSRDTISNAERGEHSLQASTLHKVARALGKAPSELLAEEERLAPKVESSSLEPTFNHVLEDERRLENEAALAFLFRGLARRARLIAERSRREGPSAELNQEAIALHQEEAALRRIRGRRGTLGRESEELADAVEAYEEANATIQAMLRQDIEATPEERATARRFKPGAPDRRREADAS